ncbi:uncharacterized protein LOC123016353 [Tribolium madens]|uniref:uncharacterized protein LOC123016353 n=1 Tax=Tribolium madens TaxID=41895 RepID=UPI001CF7229D|nr:uncharacterized protein LOC123016353 [Tribolium madens]
MKLIVAIFFLISSTSAATECYTCSTATKPQCETLSDVSMIDTCKSTTNEINCVMYKFKLNTKDFIYRGCLTKDRTCDDEKNSLNLEKKEVLECKLCDTNLCTNSVTQIKLPIILTIITFIVLQVTN